MSSPPSSPGAQLPAALPSEEYFQVSAACEPFVQCLPLLQKGKYLRGVQMYYSSLKEHPRRHSTLAYLHHFSTLHKAFLKYFLARSSLDGLSSLLLLSFLNNLQNYFSYLNTVLQVRNKNRVRKYYDALFQLYLQQVVTKEVNTKQPLDSEDIKWTYNVDEIFEGHTQTKDNQQNNHHLYFATFENQDRQLILNLTDQQMFRRINTFLNGLFKAANIMGELVILQNVGQECIQLFSFTERVIKLFGYYNQMMDTNFFQFCFRHYVTYAHILIAQNDYPKTVYFYQKAIKMQQSIIKQQQHPDLDESLDPTDLHPRARLLRTNYQNILLLLVRLFQLSLQHGRVCKVYDLFLLSQEIVQLWIFDSSPLRSQVMKMLREYKQLYGEYLLKRGQVNIVMAYLVSLKLLNLESKQIPYLEQHQPRRPSLQIDKYLGIKVKQQYPLTHLSSLKQTDDKKADHSDKGSLFMFKRFQKKKKTRNLRNNLAKDCLYSYQQTSINRHSPFTNASQQHSQLSIFHEPYGLSKPQISISTPKKRIFTAKKHDFSTNKSISGNNNRLAESQEPPVPSPRRSLSKENLDLFFLKKITQQQSSSQKHLPFSAISRYSQNLQKQERLDKQEFRNVQGFLENKSKNHLNNSNKSLLDQIKSLKNGVEPKYKQHYKIQRQVLTTPPDLAQEETSQSPKAKSKSIVSFLKLFKTSFLQVPMQQNSRRNAMVTKRKGDTQEVDTVIMDYEQKNTELNRQIKQIQNGSRSQKKAKTLQLNSTLHSLSQSIYKR